MTPAITARTDPRIVISFFVEAAQPHYCAVIQACAEFFRSQVRRCVKANETFQKL
jgi:hypothetical protein